MLVLFKFYFKKNKMLYITLINYFLKKKHYLFKNHIILKSLPFWKSKKIKVLGFCSTNKQTNKKKKNIYTLILRPYGLLAVAF